MNHAITIILAGERRMVSRFVAAGATSREQARPLEQLGVSRGVILRRLRERAVVRQVGTDLYYVDQESWTAVRRMRRRTASVMVAIALAIVFAIVFGARRARAQEARPIDWTAVDSVFRQWNRKDSPGCTLGVFRNGRIAYERGYGMADLENDIPITPASVFYIGSVSKQFTAMAAALAMQRDGRSLGNGARLSADDPIRKWLSELPAYADSITVRDLVHHTSGLRDYNTLLAIAGRRGDEAYDNATVLRMTARQKGLNFAPGTEYLYSNTGYTLLATIVERATKTPFATYAEASIFKPLGMTDSHFHTDAGRLVKRRAYAYSVRPDGAVRLDTPSNERAGAGGVYTSIRDLLHWDENFYTGQVGGKALIEQLQTPGRLRNGKELTYAWGLQVGQYRGLPVVEHSGSLGGYRAHLIRFSNQHTSFAALCNLAINPGALLRQVADIVLDEHVKAPRPGAAAPPAQTPAAASSLTIAVDAQVLSGYAGKYLSDEIDSVFDIAVTNGQLTLQRDSDAEPIPLRPLQVDSFRAPSFTVRFVKDEGRVTSLIVDAGRVRGIEFERERR